MTNKRGKNPNSHKAGAANLAKFQQTEEFKTQNITHGAHSVSIRKRYSDLRTSGGKRLKAVEDALIEDLGGPAEVNAAQSVILGGLRSKFIVVFQIGDFLDRQTSIVSKDGELLPCLGRNFLSYTDSIRRDLETLYGMTKSKIKRNIPKLADLIAKSKEDSCRTK